MQQLLFASVFASKEVSLSRPILLPHPAVDNLFIFADLHCSHSVSSPHHFLSPHFSTGILLTHDALLPLLSFCLNYHSVQFLPTACHTNCLLSPLVPVSASAPLSLSRLIPPPRSPRLRRPRRSPPPVATTPTTRRRTRPMPSPRSAPRTASSRRPSRPPSRASLPPRYISHLFHIITQLITCILPSVCPGLIRVAQSLSLSRPVFVQQLTLLFTLSIMFSAVCFLIYHARDAGCRRV